MNMMRVELFLISDLPQTEELLDTLTTEFGGYTSVSGDGAYVGNSGNIILDEVLICTMFIEDTLSNRTAVHEYMDEYRVLAEQESVLYVINGNDATFITE